MNKRVLKIFSLLVLLSVAIQPAVFAANSSLVFKPELKMSINGVVAKFNYGEPAIENGRSLIPIRDLLVGLGISDDDEHIIWTSKTKSVTIIKEETTISLAVDSKDILKNDEIIQQLEVPAKIINNRVYLPARAVAEVLGFFVSYDEKTENILITNVKPPETTTIENKDISPPTVTTAIASTGVQIEVTFNEPIDKATAENIANYAVDEKYGSVSALKIISAVQEADNTKVKLTTSTQEEFAMYTLAVFNVKDSNGNEIVLNPIAFFGSKGAPLMASSDPITSPILHVISLSKTKVEIRFARPLNKASAEVASNYSVKETLGLGSDLAIIGAKLQSDEVTVILTTKDQTSILYTLTIKNLTESSGNKIVADKTLTFAGLLN